MMTGMSPGFWPFRTRAAIAPVSRPISYQSKSTASNAPRGAPPLSRT